MTDIGLSSMQVSLSVSAKALKTSNPEPCAWPCSAMSIPNGKEMVLVLLVQFPRFCVKVFLGCI